MANLNSPTSVKGCVLRRIGVVLEGFMAALFLAFAAIVGDAWMAPQTTNYSAPLLAVGVSAIIFVGGWTTIAGFKRMSRAEKRTAPEGEKGAIVVTIPCEPVDGSGFAALLGCSIFLAFIASSAPWSLEFGPYLWPVTAGLITAGIASTFIGAATGMDRWERVPVEAMEEARRLRSEGFNIVRVSVELQQKYQTSLRVGQILARMVAPPANPASQKLVE